MGPTKATSQTYQSFISGVDPSLTFYQFDFDYELLPGIWQTITRFNPVLYLISGFRWSFFDVADVPVGVSLAAIVIFMALCLGAIWLIFKTGWRIKQ